MHLLKRSIFLLLAIGLLIFALKDVSFGSLVQQFRQANYTLIALVGLVMIISYLLRGKRWQLQLQALGYQPTVLRTTVAMQTGMIASMIILGSGELTRCITLQRTDGVPVAQGIGSAVAERIIDIFMLMLVLLLTSILEFERVQSYVQQLTFRVPSTYITISTLVALVVFAIVAKWIFTSQRFRSHPLVIKLLSVLDGFSRGFMTIRKVPQLALFILLTILIQVSVWLSTYLMLMSLESTVSLPPTAALTILATSSIGGLAVPTQSGIGTFHFLVSRVLVLYGFSSAEGAIVATFIHTIGFSINLILSSLSFLILPLLIVKPNTHEPERIK
ncbi:UPF0104 family protein [Fibrisoma montanum]|uniref:UPF0104 family protein n=1 Tax=Fibrisoma montanum TaxID=2305895 RepID=A0A418M865_9BACT|nr:lysylphosphatidylglycerol synthase transmembrane domain-containing protein [Fibrisoma montanum]RIV22284.1 UPF0104 family protein [Fibrisoma montanum]